MSKVAENIEALLFALGRAVSRNELVKKLGVSAEDIEVGITELSRMQLGGITLVDDGRMVELRTAPASSELIEQIQKEESSRDIGKAGLEALAAILYRGPLTRAEIDFIRGVNSSQTLRTLLMRGLIRRVDNPKDERSFLYEPTTDLFAYLGIATRSALPNFEETRDKLQALENAYRAKEAESN